MTFSIEGGRFDAAMAVTGALRVPSGPYGVLAWHTIQELGGIKYDDC